MSTLRAHHLLLIAGIGLLTALPMTGQVTVVVKDQQEVDQHVLFYCGHLEFKGESFGPLMEKAEEAHQRVLDGFKSLGEIELWTFGARVIPEEVTSLRQKGKNWSSSTSWSNGGPNTAGTCLLTLVYRLTASRPVGEKSGDRDTFVQSVFDTGTATGLTLGWGQLAGVNGALPKEGARASWEARFQIDKEVIFQCWAKLKKRCELLEADPNELNLLQYQSTSEDAQNPQQFGTLTGYLKKDPPTRTITITSQITLMIKPHRARITADCYGFGNDLLELTTELKEKLTSASKSLEASALDTEWGRVTLAATEGQQINNELVFNTEEEFAVQTHAAQSIFVDQDWDSAEPFKSLVRTARTIDVLKESGVSFNGGGTPIDRAIERAMGIYRTLDKTKKRLSTASLFARPTPSDAQTAKALKEALRRARKKAELLASVSDRPLGALNSLAVLTSNAQQHNAGIKVTVTVTASWVTE